MAFAAVQTQARESVRPVPTPRQVARRLLVLLVLLIGPALGSPVAHAEDEAPTKLKNRPYVVMIHADWCGTCKAVAPVWKQIQADLADETTVVTLDVTDRPAYTASREAARRLGIAEFFNAYRAKTGTIAVLACETHEPVAVLSGERNFEAYRAAVTKAACKAS